MKLLQRLYSLRTGIAVSAAVVLLLAAWNPTPTSAVVAGSACSGNICIGSITVGGQAVQYSYTQHLKSNGQFRIRFNGGVYNTSQLVSFILSNMPAFSSTGYLANPTNGATAMTETNVNPGMTAYERLSSTGCASCIYDHVMSVQYAALAAGVYTFNFTILQNGSSGGMVSVPFYVDAGAPVNTNESNTWTSSGSPVVPGMDYPCADTADNDLDFKTDCADSQCVGQIGKVVSGALCQATETTCNDGFDNDGDGLTDCLDADCNGRVGQPFGTALCQFGNEKGASTCGDSFDNDGDGLTDCTDNTATDSNPANTCWKQSGYGCPATENSCTDNIDNDKDKSYSSTWDNVGSTGVDCQDYDCAGNIACPAAENYDKNGVQHDEQCFNGIDDDLDTKIDCADPNCANVINPGNPSQACYAAEFDISQHYQYCANSFDDNGNGAIDCSDLSCKRQFGNCGPCPVREDLSWDSCADSKDNDTDAQTDCADTANCNDKVGSTAAGAICATTENTDRACGDGFDNDLDGKIDCADATCAGHVGPLGVTCQSPNETSCSDGLDNDGDGLIDCVDPSCAGVGSCAAASWTQAAACQVVPLYSGQTAFTSVSPTITATVRLTTHVSSVDTIELKGTGTYTSVTVVIGDNTTSTAYYPYAAASPACALSGTGASSFGFVVANNHAIEIYDTGAAASFGPFDIILTCNTPATPAAQVSYPISLSALKPGGVQEYGDVTFSTTLLEATPPTMTEVEGEGVVGTTITVPYGGVTNPPTRRFRGVPNDPNPYSSGICRCDLDVGGTAFPGAADCVTTPIAFLSDVASLAVRGRAEDGAGNLGAYGGNITYSVNVTPVNSQALTLLPSTPFFKNGAMNLGRLTAGYITGGTDSFSSSCGVYMYTDSGTLVNGPIGPSWTFPGVVAGNTLLCDITGTTPPSGLSDGRYFVKVRATDTDSNYVNSNPQVLYICNTIPGPTDPEPTNGCQYADFDHDGSSEGLYTSLYSSSTKFACDNCVNLSNPSQDDANADGIGDVCEPTNQYGRCEIDTDINCLYDSDNPVHCTSGTPDPLCCPGPSHKNDPSTGSPKNPQQCKLTWGTCTLSGGVCFSSPQCPGGQGTCQNGTTACYVDADCAGVPGTPLCSGADACDDRLYPWIQTVYGNVFTKKKIDVPDVPPKNLYNATYCVTAKETIVNFITEGQGSCSAQTDAASRLDFPDSANRYTSVLGNIDVTGLRNGKYGTVTTVSGSQLDATLSLNSERLGGRVIRVTGDATVSAAHVIANDSSKGSGTVLVDGGNLYINGNVSYDAVNTVDDLKKLASLGWVVLADGSGNGGNVYVDKSVTTVSGAFYVSGTDGFYSVAPPEPNSITPFTLYGLVIAHDFHLNRTYKSLTTGAERFIYDGRAVVNPPPGFADVTKALPTLTDTPGP